MREVYIILSFTGTALSRIIRGFTGAEYAHASISLDKELTQMYSFGRLNPMNPFIGGFVHEGIHHGTFKRFKNTEAGVFALTVTEEQYDNIKAEIENIGENKKDYKFNVIGLAAVSINKRITEDKSFYCAEFVKHVLDEAKIDLKLPDMIKPEDFKTVPNLKLEYKGKLREYDYEKDVYLEKIG